MCIKHWETQSAHPLDLIFDPEVSLACGTVRGKPSSTKPRRHCGRAMSSERADLMALWERIHVEHAQTTPGQLLQALPRNTQGPTQTPDDPIQYTMRNRPEARS